MTSTKSIGAVAPKMPGLKITELLNNSTSNTPGFGAVAFLGNFKRGPMGVPVPVRDSVEYQRIFGKPGDPNWHLFKDSSSLAPDAIDGFFTEAGRNTAVIIRNQLDGKAEAASVILNSRTSNNPVLKIKAANEGRWGGSAAGIELSPLVVVSDRTFTLVAPGVKVNQFKDAIVTFEKGSASYKIVANSPADASTGEVVFTVSSQYNLLGDGVSGPATLSGTVDYTRQRELSGSIELARFKELSGTATSTGTVVTGTNTAFSSEVEVGEVIYAKGEPRIVVSLTSDTTLTIESPFTSELESETLSVANSTVTGSGTFFTSELAAGDMLMVTLDGDRYERTVTEITSDTELKVNSSYPVAVEPGTAAATYNYWVEEVAATDFDNELKVGDFIIDPNRSGEAVRVVEIDTAAAPSRFRVAKIFSQDFNDAQIVKQDNRATVELIPLPEEGLEVEVGQGVRFPYTHFSLSVYFQGSLVFSANDISLDPEDPLYAEKEINNRNIAYKFNNQTYNEWISAEVLFQGSYTTAASNDVRPAVSSSIALAVEPNRVYTVERFNRQILAGKSFFPNPYTLARQSYRIAGYVAPMTLEGTFVTTGTTAIGTSTTFGTDFRIGDYFYSSQTNEARKIIAINSDVELELASAFSSDVGADSQTAPQKSGYFVFNQGSGVEASVTVGAPYLANVRAPLTGGYDGDTTNILPSWWTRYLNADNDLISKAVEGLQLGLVRIAIPGVSEPSVSRAGYTYADSQSFIFRAEIPEYLTSAALVENFINNDLGRAYYEVAYPSYIAINDPYSRGERLISISGDIMGLESRFAAESQGYHRVAAGNDAILSRATSIPQELSATDIEILTASGVQPIKKQFGSYIPFGNTSPSSNVIYQKIHVKRIQCHYMRTFLELKILSDQVFKVISEAELRNIYMGIDRFFREEYRKGVITNLLSIDDTYEVNIPLIEAVGRTKNDVVLSVVNGKIELFASYLPVGVTEKLEIFVSPDLATRVYATQQ